MAGIKNRNENVGTRQRTVASHRETQYGPPVLLRLPKVRIDSPHLANTEKQFTAVAEGTTSTTVTQSEQPKIDPRASLASAAVLNTTTSVATATASETQSTVTPADKTQVLPKKNWLDDWTNGVIIFLVAVVVFTTAILALRSPSVNLGKWLPSNSSQDRLVDKSDSNESTSVASTPTKSEASANVSPQETNKGPVALMAEKPVSNGELRIDSSSNSNSASPARGSIQPDSNNGSTQSPAAMGLKNELLDLSAAPAIPENLETREDADSIASAENLAAPYSQEFQASDIAGTNEPETANAQLGAPSQSVLETQFAESEIPQLVELLKQQRAAQGGNFANANMAGMPNGAQFSPSQMVSGPATGFSAMPVPYVQQLSGQNLGNPRLQPPINYQQPMGQGGILAPGPANGLAPRPGPYQQVLPGLIQEMGNGQGYMIQPPGMQPTMSQPMVNQQPMNNFYPVQPTAPVRSPYVPIGPGLPNQP